MVKIKVSGQVELRWEKVGGQVNLCGDECADKLSYKGDFTDKADDRLS